MEYFVLETFCIVVPTNTIHMVNYLWCAPATQELPHDGKNQTNTTKAWNYSQGCSNFSRRSFPAAEHENTHPIELLCTKQNTKSQIVIQPKAGGGMP
uniref:Uncharacterized protein n=1 Tax=Arundo donax TaxID=35708 RepID=A0A0A9A1H5_ARUDO